MTAKEIIQQISEILAKHDPMGLISAGAPSDEYSTEASLIFAAEATTFESLEKIFTFCFDMDVNISNELLEDLLKIGYY